MIFYVLLVLSLLLAVEISMRYSRFGRLVNKIPSPTVLPIIGHAHLLLTDDREYLWNFFRDQIKTYYPVLHVTFPGQSLIVCSDPEDCKTLLTDRANLTKASIYKKFKVWIYNSVFISPVDLWAPRRKLLTPAFHPHILRKYVETMQEQGEKFMSKLANKGDEVVHEVMPLTLKITMNIICASAMGVDVSSMENDTDAYIKAVKDYFEIMAYRFCKPYVTDWMLKFLPLIKKQNASLATFRAFTRKIINIRKQNFEIETQSFNEINSQTNDNEDNVKVSHKAMPVLDLLLLAESKNLISERDVRSEVDTFLFGGYDTSAIVLSFTLILLAENKEVQNKARSEATDVLNRCEGRMNINDIQTLDYIDRCIKEGLRLFPSVPFVLRKLVKDAQLKDYLLPAGAEFVIPIFEIHRDPRHWPDPEKFDPDRFLPENSRNRHPYAYMPFSAGPRNCIGQKFGILELKVLLAQILCNFQIEPVTRIKDLKFEFSAMLTSKTPLYVKFNKLVKE